MGSTLLTGTPWGVPTSGCGGTHREVHAGEILVGAVSFHATIFPAGALLLNVAKITGTSIPREQLKNTCLSKSINTIEAPYPNMNTY